MSGSGSTPQAPRPVPKSASAWTPDISTATQAVGYMRLGGTAAVLAGFLVVATAPTAAVQIISVLMYGGLAVGLFCYSRIAGVAGMLWAVVIDAYLILGGTVNRVISGFLGEQHIVQAPGTPLGVHMAPVYPPAFSAGWWTSALPCLAALAITWVFLQSLRATFLHHDFTGGATSPTRSS